MGTYTLPPSVMCSIAAAAALMGVSHQTVRNMITRGDWPTEVTIRRAGDRVLVNREQLEAWCRGEETGAAS